MYRPKWPFVLIYMSHDIYFDSVHCSESLFGTLFMDTVHEHCSRGFQKNKIK